MFRALFASWLMVRYPAAAIGWLIGKAIVGLVWAVVWLVRCVAYLVGSVGGWLAGLGRSGPPRSSPPGRP
jgi:hypothetical protein